MQEKVRLDKKLTEKGYKVIIVAETATEVILSGIKANEIPIDEFQRIIIERGLCKEETVRRVAHLFDKDVIIFYDRGILDGKAYMSEESFIRILKENNKTEIEVRDSYDAVFHLVTAAIGAEHAYTTANNKARFETIPQARLADKRTKDAWLGHPHMRVIDNSTDFKGKIDRLINEVYAVIGIPVPVEIERKFLISRPTEEILSSHECVKSQIVQTYLREDNSGIERRVRQRGIDGKFSFYYTEKKETLPDVREEVEKRISKDEYLRYLTEGVKTVRKDRYCFFYENQYFELDIYPDWNENAILEIELTKEGQEVKLPDWLFVKKEVTGQKEYANVNIAN